MKQTARGRSFACHRKDPDMNLRTPAFLLAALLAVPACGGGETGPNAADPAVDGRLEDGLRVLTFAPAADGGRLVVYRGDYVRPETEDGAPFTLEIPELDVRMSVPAPEGTKPYFKVPEPGVYAWRIGDARGELEALEFRDARYREVSAAEAADYVAAVDPLVLDVRTPREYEAGHLEGAVLIPVQTLAQRLDELSGREREPVLVYCRTGNRSTVAAKMLIDAGFERVVNMRRGIVEWQREGLPTAP